MEVFASISALVLAMLFLTHKNRQIDAVVSKKINVNDFQEQIEQALSPPKRVEESLILHSTGAGSTALAAKGDQVLVVTFRALT